MELLCLEVIRKCVDVEAGKHGLNYEHSGTSLMVGLNDLGHVF